MGHPLIASYSIVFDISDRSVGISNRRTIELLNYRNIESFDCRADPRERGLKNKNRKYEVLKFEA